MTKKKPKPIRAWGVFGDGKLLLLPDPYATDCQQFQIYKTREQARRIGEDYRRVTITIKP